MHFSESGHPLGKYNIGQRVCCLVKKLKKKGGCSVILEDEVEGFVDAQHCGGKCNISLVSSDYNI